MISNRFNNRMSDLIDFISNIGVENVRFLVNLSPIHTFCGLISFTSSGDEIPMLCTIDESRYPIKNDYKITLRSIEQFKGIRGYQHFYVSDLQHMINDGRVKMMVEITEDNINQFNK